MLRRYLVKFAADPLRPIPMEATSPQEAARAFAYANGYTAQDRDGEPGGWVIEVWEEHEYPSCSPYEFYLAEVV